MSDMLSMWELIVNWVKTKVLRVAAERTVNVGIKCAVKFGDAIIDSRQ